MANQAFSPQADTDHLDKNDLLYLFSTYDEASVDASHAQVSHSDSKREAQRKPWCCLTHMALLTWACAEKSVLAGVLILLQRHDSLQCFLQNFCIPLNALVTVYGINISTGSSWLIGSCNIQSWRYLYRKCYMCLLVVKDWTHLNTHWSRDENCSLLPRRWEIWICFRHLIDDTWV